MSGNTLGRLFRVTSYGESHGQAIGGVIDGIPSGIPIDIDGIEADLQKRRTAQSKFTSQRKEPDKLQILSGVFEGKTLGTPIGFLVENCDAKPKHYDHLKDLFRPGHGDYTYHKKYGHRDHRGGGRASARETLIRVVAGAFAKMYLKTLGIEIYGYLAQMGSLKINAALFDKKCIQSNPFFCPDPSLVKFLEADLAALRKAGDSIGGRVEVVATGVPEGLGEPVYDGLDAQLAKAMMSINAVKGVSLGGGFECVSQKGSEFRDEMVQEGFVSNHAGGTLAGISTGQDLQVSLAFKPASSILVPGRTLTKSGEETRIQTGGRHDPCVALRGVVVAEAMMALVLADQCLIRYGQTRPSIET